MPQSNIYIHTHTIRCMRALLRLVERSAKVCARARHVSRQRANQLATATSIQSSGRSAAACICVCALFEGLAVASWLVVAVVGLVVDVSSLMAFATKQYNPHVYTCAYLYANVCLNVSKCVCSSAQNNSTVNFSFVH